jgi:hypothetical protein
MRRPIRLAMPAIVTAGALLLGACNDEETDSGSSEPSEQAEQSEQQEGQDQQDQQEEAAAFVDADAEGYWQTSPEPGANLLLIGWGEDAGAVTYLQGTEAGSEADLCSGSLSEGQLQLECMRGSTAYVVGWLSWQDEETLNVDWAEGPDETLVAADGLEDMPMEELQDQWGSM